MDRKVEASRSGRSAGKPEAGVGKPRSCQEGGLSCPPVPGSRTTVLRQECPQPSSNRASSSCASSARGRSRSTPRRARTPRTVSSLKGGGSERRTCRASRSKREMVVRMVKRVVKLRHFTNFFPENRTSPKFGTSSTQAIDNRRVRRSDKWNGVSLEFEFRRGTPCGCPLGSKPTPPRSTAGTWCGNHGVAPGRSRLPVLGGRPQGSPLRTGSRTIGMILPLSDLRSNPLPLFL